MRGCVLGSGKLDRDPNMYVGYLYDMSMVESELAISLQEEGSTSLI